MQRRDGERRKQRPIGKFIQLGPRLWHISSLLQASNPPSMKVEMLTGPWGKVSTAPSTCPPGGGSGVYTRAHFWCAEEGQAINGAPIASSADAPSEACADADGEQGLLVYPAHHLDGGHRPRKLL